MKNSVTIYTGALEKIKVSKKNVQLTVEAETELRKLLWARKTIDDIIAKVTDQLGIAMEKLNLTLVEREYIKVTRQNVGRRFSFDPTKEVNPKFCQTTSYLQPNVKAIDAYLELNKKIPTGILENARKQKVEIRLIEDNE